LGALSFVSKNDDPNVLIGEFGSIIARSHDVEAD
jgi:hypothetical protein